jgi:hypothetical protein
MAAVFLALDEKARTDFVEELFSTSEFLALALPLARAIIAGEGSVETSGRVDESSGESGAAQEPHDKVQNGDGDEEEVVENLRRQLAETRALLEEERGRAVSPAHLQAHPPTICKLIEDGYGWEGCAVAFLEEVGSSLIRILAGEDPDVHDAVKTEVIATPRPARGRAGNFDGGELLVYAGDRRVLVKIESKAAKSNHQSYAEKLIEDARETRRCRPDIDRLVVVLIQWHTSVSKSDKAAAGRSCVADFVVFERMSEPQNLWRAVGELSRHLRGVVGQLLRNSREDELLAELTEERALGQNLSGGIAKGLIPILSAFASVNDRSKRNVECWRKIYGLAEAWLGENSAALKRGANDGAPHRSAKKPRAESIEIST